MNLAKLLHKVGAASFQHPWWTISSWLVILAMLGLGAAQFYQAPSSNISIPGTQGQQAIDRVGELFSDSGGASGRIVFKADDGVQNHTEQITKLVDEVNQVDGIAQAVSPFIDSSFVSSDGTIAYAHVQLDEQIGSIDPDTLSSVEDIVAHTRSSDLQVEIGGDLVTVVPEVFGVGELIGVGIALLVLIVTFSSLIAGGMPILSALLGVGVSIAGLFALGQVVDINSTTPVLAIMLGLAVGIDYSLFIVNKYRKYVIDGLALEEAAARALGTAGNAVVFAASTVVIALAALSVVRIPFMTIMGLAGAASIAIAAAVSLTLIPALLGLVKMKIFNKKDRAKFASKGPNPANQRKMWNTWAVTVTRRPILVLLLALAVVATLALPIRSLTLGLPTDQFAATESTQRKAYDLLSEGFGVGFNAPLVVLVEGLPKVSDADKTTVREAALAEYNQKVAEATKEQETTFIAQLQAAQTPAEQAALMQAAVQAKEQAAVQKQAALAEIEKQVDQYAKYVQLNAVATGIGTLDNVDVVQPALVTDDGTAGVIQVIPNTAPADKETKNLIAALRDDKTVNKLTAQNDVTLSVTGTAALQGDINQKLADALPLYLVTIVGLSLILLLIAFRSVVVPIKATLGYILSVLAMFGATVAVFQWGWFGLADSVGPIISFVPIIAAGILFGLAMDYEFFLVSGIHEAHTHTDDARQSVVEGFNAGAKVVTAAAVIMVSVFAGFITSKETVIQSIGFALAIGILVDAFIVRMVIVPAVMSLLGKSAWWLPKWLDKFLPHVSIEGEAAEKK